MNEIAPVKKGLTLAWSIGLGVLLLGITTVALMPATKNARIRFNELQQELTEDESNHEDPVEDESMPADHRKAADPMEKKDGSTPPQSP